MKIVKCCDLRRANSSNNIFWDFKISRMVERMKKGMDWDGKSIGGGEGKGKTQ